MGSTVAATLGAWHTTAASKLPAGGLCRLAFSRFQGGSHYSLHLGFVLRPLGPMQPLTGCSLLRLFVTAQALQCADGFVKRLLLGSQFCEDG